MDFLEFKTPKEIGKLLGIECFLSYIIKNQDGFKIAFYQQKNNTYDIVFDFGYTVEDYRVSREGRRFDHHMYENLSEPWLFVEVKNSDYIKKINEESEGVLLTINPNLKHYMVGDIDNCIDIISFAEPTVYKAKRMYQAKIIKLSF